MPYVGDIKFFPMSSSPIDSLRFEEDNFKKYTLMNDFGDSKRLFLRLDPLNSTFFYKESPRV